MAVQTVKHRIGKVVLPMLPFNRRTFDILRWEFRMLTVRIGNKISPSHHRTVRALRAKTGLSVNIGSGGKGLEGWVNIEGLPAADSVLTLDVRRPLPLADGSAVRVLAEHIMEHLDFRSDALALAREAHRVLAPGGVFRVVVPDCERYIRAYVARDQTAFADLGWDIDQPADDIFTPMHIVNHQFHQEGEHLFGYDFETMMLLLQKAGFSRVERMSFGQSLDPDLAIDQPNHAPYSLYVDAVR